MQRFLPLLGLLIILGYGFYNAKHQSTPLVEKAPADTYRQHLQTHSHSHTKELLSKIHTDETRKQYIIEVINHGSVQLKFKKDEIMEGGYAPREDAAGIACYVMTLSGASCPEGYPPESVGYYTSICGGCHGDDGRGLNGTYPDLTRNPLLGIQKKEDFLRSRVAPEP